MCFRLALLNLASSSPHTKMKITQNKKCNLTEVNMQTCSGTYAPLTFWNMVMSGFKLIIRNVLSILMVLTVNRGGAYGIWVSHAGNARRSLAMHTLQNQVAFLHNASFKQFCRGTRTSPFKAQTYTPHGSSDKGSIRPAMRQEGCNQQGTRCHSEDSTAGSAGAQNTGAGMSKP